MHFCMIEKHWIPSSYAKNVIQSKIPSDSNCENTVGIQIAAKLDSIFTVSNENQTIE